MYFILPCLLFGVLCFAIGYSEARAASVVAASAIRRSLSSSSSRRGSSSSEARRRRQAEEERYYQDALSKIRVNPQITIWGTDYRSRRNKPDNIDYCRDLNSTWFHKIRYIDEPMYLSTDALKYMGNLYMKHVYTASNFPETWRNPETWVDSFGNPLYLKEFDEAEIKKYYYEQCPQPCIISAILKAAINFGIMVFVFMWMALIFISLILLFVSFIMYICGIKIKSQ
jgi:hypothetical protein